MKNGIPLIFFHMGDSYYLQYTFNQILQSNPDSDVYLIGDDKNKHYESIGIKHVDMTACEKTAKEFEKIYVHLSCMGGFVERICFQRWMYIRDFVASQNMTTPFCYLDSDVLVYGNISDYYKEYCADYDLAFNEKCGPPCMMFKSIAVLSKLVDNIFKYYSNPSLVEFLRREHIETGKNITDMRMIELFSDECDVTTYDLKQIVDKKTFDHSLTGYKDKRFVKKDKFKKVFFKNEVAYCREVDTGEFVMMMTLHIQGFYKMYMYRYYTGPSKMVMPKWKARAQLFRQLAKRGIYRFLVFTKLKKSR